MTSIATPLGPLRSRARAGARTCTRARAALGTCTFLCAMLFALLLPLPSQARVTRIVIDESKPMPVVAGGIAYEQLAGRAFGELDPRAPGNRIIQDIELAKDADGKVRYVASFVLTKPIAMGQASGLLWHDVPNRGTTLPNYAAQALERASGDINLMSAWQGDNSGATTVRSTMAVTGTHWLQLPVAKGPGGTPITGDVFGRIVNRSGPGSQPLMVQVNPLPYKPMSLGHPRVAPGFAPRRVHPRRSNWRNAHCRHRLGLGQVRRGQPLPRHARCYANLPQKRL